MGDERDRWFDEPAPESDEGGDDESTTPGPAPAGWLKPPPGVAGPPVEEGDEIRTAPMAAVPDEAAIATARADSQRTLAGDPVMTPKVRATPARPEEIDAGAPSPLLQPSSFDERYRKASTLGQGGMGVVTLHQDRVVGRPVALKTAHAAADGSKSQGATWRFIREARVQGQLEHPAVVPVYDLGTDQNGAVYFTMQRVRGRSLGEVLTGSSEESTAGRLSTRKVLDVLDRVALALDYAHHRGVVHRDLKPENIMVGDYGEVFILDWGLARVQGSEDLATQIETATDERVAITSDRMTRAGEVLGTPGYMAPEQIQDPSKVDARADLYAFGAILYEALCGLPLHGGGELHQLIYTTMKLDGAELPEELEVAPELAALVAHLTRKDPAHRPESARAVAEAIEAFLDGERDASLRQKAARHHLEEARELLGAGGRDELETRRRALQEVGRALALSPDLEAARSLLFELLTSPPATVPPEAQEALDSSARETVLMSLRSALVGYLVMSLFVPIALWMGIRSWTAFIALGGAMFGCFLYTAYFLWRPPKVLKLPVTHVLLTSATVGISCVMFGPLVLVPMLAVSNSVSYLTTLKDKQWLPIAGGVIAVVLPALLQMGGLLPASYAISQGVINILPWMMDFPPLPTMAFLVATQAGIVITACVFVMRLTRRAAEAEKKVHLQAWQLEQMIGRVDGNG